MTLTNEEAEQLHGQDVIDVEGEKVGSIEDLYVDADTGAPEWALLNRGFLGLAHSVVPLVGAVRDDDRLRVIFSKDAIKRAPDVDADAAISEEDEGRLYDHYREHLPEIDGAIIVETYDLRATRRPSQLRRSRK